MSSVKISIIVPVYNVESYLEESLNSIIANSENIFELILVDDGSTDESGRICECYAEQYDYIKVIHQNNGGITKARRSGLEIAQGEYVWFVDGDDWIEGKAVEYLVEQLNKKRVDIIAFCYQRTNAGKVVVSHGIRSGYYTREDALYLSENIFECQETEKAGIIPSICTMIVKKELYITAFEKLTDDVQRIEDTAVSIVVALLSKSMLILEDVLYFVRVREGSIMHSQDLEYFKHINAFYKYMSDFFAVCENKDLLMKNLDKYMDESILLGLNKSFRYDNKIRIPNYVCSLNDFSKDTRILLYGAEIVGQSYYKYIKAEKKCQIIDWFDIRYKEYQKMGFDVKNPDTIPDYTYDYIVIAVLREELFLSIKARLIDKYKVDDKCIYWERPINILDYYA